MSVGLKHNLVNIEDISPQEVYGCMQTMEENKHEKLSFKYFEEERGGH